MGRFNKQKVIDFAIAEQDNLISIRGSVFEQGTEYYIKNGKCRHNTEDTTFDFYADYGKYEAMQELLEMIYD